MYDFGRSHDLLVTDALAGPVAAALPGWRIFSTGTPLPDDAQPVAVVVPAGDDLTSLDASGHAGLAVIRMSDIGSLSQSLADLLAEKLQEAQRDAAEARRAAALLRRENEEQMRRMRMLEHFTHALGGPRHLKALDWAPTSLFLELGGAVTQRLPLNTVALAAIDLWLPDADPDEAAETAIELLDTDGNPIARLAAEPGGGAWVRFSAATPLAGPARDVVMRVIAPSRRAIALGLTSPVPDPRFAVHMNASPVAEAALAVRAWRADYLAALPRPNAIEGGAATQVPLVNLGKPELLSAPTLAQDYVATEYWPREDAILLHPSAEGPVCAILRDVDLMLVSGISALVNVAHRDAPVLGFAIGACPRGLATPANWQDHIGPYVFLPPGGWGECHHILPDPARGRTDVLLSTMLASRGPNHNSWALFHDLRLTGAPA